MILVLSIVAVGSLVYIIYYPPKFVFDYLSRKHPDVLFQVSVPFSRRVVALTLDDCPSSSTAAMLDILKDTGARATFFVIGDQVPGNEHIIQRIHDEGHEVGNHAWTDEKTILRPLHEVERQIKAVDALIPSNANGRKYFRPGGGFFTRKMTGLVKSLGYQTVLGCIYPHDPQISSVWVNTKHVLRMVRPGGIIIMHDRRAHSAPQLEAVVKGLRDRQWEVVSLGTLLETCETEDER